MDSYKRSNENVRNATAESHVLHRVKSLY